jgi:hypothetical protein
LVGALGFAVAAFVSAWVQRRRARHLLRDSLKPGAIVLVSTGDGRRLVARILSRGIAHYWIELPPGDARWWVPVSAVKPAPERAARGVAFKRPFPAR